MPIIVGETVAFWLPHVTGEDDFGNEVIGYGRVAGGLTWDAMTAETWHEVSSSTWADMLAAWDDLLSDPFMNTWELASELAWSRVRTANGFGAIKVNNVLVNPSTTTYDRIEAGRPYGYEADLTLYLPKAFDTDVRRALVDVRGERYKVVGDPERYTDANLPPGCEWNLVVKVARYDIG